MDYEDAQLDSASSVKNPCVWLPETVLNVFIAQISEAREKTDLRHNQFKCLDTS